MNRLGEKLRKHRKQNALSLDELARITDTSKSYLWELEKNRKLKPSAEKIAIIARALDVTLDYLMCDHMFYDEHVRKEALWRAFLIMSKGDQKKIWQILDAWAK